MEEPRIMASFWAALQFVQEWNSNLRTDHRGRMEPGATYAYISDLGSRQVRFAQA